MPRHAITQEDLAGWGYVEQPDGTYAKPCGPVGRVAPHKRESLEDRALDRQPSARQGGRPCITPSPNRRRVHLTAHLTRLMDGDNMITGLKPLRDAVAMHLGIDDSDKYTIWEYSQSQTVGPPGVVVLIFE